MQFKQQESENTQFFGEKKRKKKLCTLMTSEIERAQSSLNSFSNYLKFKNIFQILW